MSDSWILIGLTILIVFLLFYISKRLICSGPLLTNSSEENPPEDPVWSSNLFDTENTASEKQIMAICDSSNNNMVDETSQMGGLHSQSQSQVENRLRSHVFHMILAEKQYQQLEMEAARLARLLTSTNTNANSQGLNTTTTGTSPENYINNLRNEMFPLITVGSFHSQQHLLRLSKHINGSTNYFLNANRSSDADVNRETSNCKNTQTDSSNPLNLLEEDEYKKEVVETIQDSNSNPSSTSLEGGDVTDIVVGIDKQCKCPEMECPEKNTYVG